MSGRGTPCGSGIFWVWIGLMPCIAFLAAVLVAPAGAQSPTRADRVKTVAPDNDQDVNKKKLPRGDASSSQQSVTTQRTPAVRQSGATRSAPPPPPPPPVTRSIPPVRSETAPAVRQPRITPATVENRAKSAETHKRVGNNADAGTPPPTSTFRRDTPKIPAANATPNQPPPPPPPLPPPPPSGTSGEKSRVSNTRKRLDDHVDIKGGKSDISTPPPLPPQRDRRTGGGKGTVGEATGAKVTSPPPAGAIDPGRVNDVRKRLGSRELGEPGDLSGHKGSSEAPKRQPPIGVKLPDSGKLHLGNQPPIGVKLPDSGKLHLDNQTPTGVKLPNHGDLNLGHDQLPGSHSSQGKAVPYAALKTRFPERAKSGNLDHLVVGGTAQKIKLADQYQLWHNGDVARQLGLEKHTQNFHHGPISPAYQNHCFKYNYWGPAFFAGACWYPSWNPWVEWSWRSHCHPFWDPRPIWCRPVIYNPCPVWVYWQVPVWTPLPVVSCGTWVDLKPPALPQEETDLQLAAVRFVDPGHPEEKLGPRYRVWFRNNGSQAITQPFNVMLFAANDGKLSADLPQAGVRVTAVEAGDTQSVDIRLPVEVYAMNRDAQGNPSPFGKLHVLVDANRELPEADRVNNGARLTPAEILPVDPAAFELEPATVSPGGEVVLAGEGLGPRPGQVLVMVNGKEFEAEVLGWYDLGARFTLPKVSIAGPTAAEVVLVRGDGAAANPLKITIAP